MSQQQNIQRKSPFSGLNDTLDEQLNFAKLQTEILTGVANPIAKNPQGKSL